MRRIRVFSAAISLAALFGAAAAAPAGAETKGVGTTRATTTAVNVSLGSNGSLLNVRLLGDDGLANIDPKQGAPSAASSSISPLTTTSSVSALNLSLPKLSVASTGAADNKSVPSVSLATPLSTGSISPLSLSAVVDAAQGASSGLNSTLTNVTAVGGLLNIPSATSSLGAAAKPGDADGLRGISIPSIQVLNLGAVLQGLGVNPANLQLGQLQQVLNKTGLTAGGLSGDALATQINGITTTFANTPLDTPAGINGLAGNTPVLGLPGPVTTVLDGLFGGSIPSNITDIAGVTSALNTQITTLLTSAINNIGATPLLQANNVTVGITTKAADTVANSKADVQAVVQSLQVGSVQIPGADLAAIVSGAQDKVNQVLTAAGLGNLVTVKALDQTKSVATQNGYVNALANLTGLHVAIAPLSSLAPGRLAAASNSTVGSLFTLAGANPNTVPALSTAMTALNGLGLPTTGTGALTDGATVDVLSVGSASAFVPSASPSTPSNPAAATPQNGKLAVTGGPTQLLGLVGLLLLASVVGIRWFRRPATSN